MLASSDVSSSELDDASFIRLFDGFILMPIMLLIHAPSKRVLLAEPAVSSASDGVLEGEPVKYVDAALHAVKISFFACLSCLKDQKVSI